ncbi:MAG: hypothetical protein GHCLOJNM_04443 [bacterium]|nr:hypothetical protein [bacterium]
MAPGGISYTVVRFFPYVFLVIPALGEISAQPPGHPIPTEASAVFESNTLEIFSTLATAELDGDPGVELVFGSDRTGDDDNGVGIFAINLDGAPVAGQWPVILNADVRSSPAVADLDGDGLDEVVIGTYGVPKTILILDHTGAQLASAQTQFDVFSSAAIGDLDGDRTLEIVIGTSDGKLVALKADGAPFANAWPVTPPRRQPPLFARNDIDSSPALGDLDGDGDLEVAALSDEGVLYVYTKEGQPLPGFPFIAPAGTFPPGMTAAANSASPLIVDLDGDHHPDVLAAMSNGRIYGFHGDGTPVNGFPLALPPGAAPDQPGRAGDDILSTPAVGDVDGDGLLELVVAFFDGPHGSSRLFVYDLNSPANADSMQWHTFHANELRRGLSPGMADGDVNRDGVVNGLDFLGVLETWQRFPTMPGYNPKLDLNRNRSIDTGDPPKLVEEFVD